MKPHWSSLPHASKVCKQLASCRGNPQWGCIKCGCKKAVEILHGSPCVYLRLPLQVGMWVMEISCNSCYIDCCYSLLDLDITSARGTPPVKQILKIEINEIKNWEGFILIKNVTGWQLITITLFPRGPQQQADHHPLS